MITMRSRGPQIDTRHIAEVEAEVGRELPASYKAFLLKENGGIPTPDTVDIDGLPGSPTDVQVFFRIGGDVESSDLSWNIDLMSELSPERRVFPVARDSGGNIFCMDVFGESAGAVMYCDLGGPHIIFYEVAPNFESFLEKIRGWEH